MSGEARTYFRPILAFHDNLPDDDRSWLLHSSEDALPHCIFTYNSEQLQDNHLYMADAEQWMLPTCALWHWTSLSC